MTDFIAQLIVLIAAAIFAVGLLASAVIAGFASFDQCPKSQKGPAD